MSRRGFGIIGLRSRSTSQLIGTEEKALVPWRGAGIQFALLPSAMHSTVLFESGTAVGRSVQEFAMTQVDIF